MMELYIKKTLIFIDPPITSKDELFRFISNELFKRGLVNNRRLFIKSLQQREELGSTNFVPAIAIPHAHCHSVNRLFMSIVISKQGFSYNKPENGTVNLAFIIGCPTVNNKHYLQLLAATARAIKNQALKERLLIATTPNEVLNLLKEYELYSNSLADTQNHLLVITLYKRERIGDLLSALIEVGVSNASIVSSTSLGKRLSYEIPVFAGLMLKDPSKSREIYTIFATISSLSIPRQVASMVKEQGLNFDEMGNGYMQIFKLEALLGHTDEFV